MKCESAQTGESHPCCDTCDPSTQMAPEESTAVPKATRKRKVHVKQISVDSMDNRDLLLKDELRKWCGKELERRGFSGEDFYGDSLVMSQRVRGRIIDLAHESKLPDTTAFIEQVQWCDAHKYAAEILEIIRSVYRDDPPVVALTPNQPSSQAPIMTAATQSLHNANKENCIPPQPCQRQCSKCKAFGHIGTLLLSLSLILSKFSKQPVTASVR